MRASVVKANVVINLKQNIKAQAFLMAFVSRRAKRMSVQNRFLFDFVVASPGTKGH